MTRTDAVKSPQTSQRLGSRGRDKLCQNGKLSGRSQRTHTQIHDAVNSEASTRKHLTQLKHDALDSASSLVPVSFRHPDTPAGLNASLLLRRLRRTMTTAARVVVSLPVLSAERRCRRLRPR